MGKWKKAASEMLRLRKKYIAVRTSESVSVHRTLILRALPLLYSHVPEAADFYEPVKILLTDNVTCPDRMGDYEKGKGRHYYCASNFLGIRCHTSGGYYRNGVMRFAKSARTMLEEDYTMALTMYNCGFNEQAMIYLARAIHMISDICCLPHATQMTYFSPKRHIHKAYEALARAMYPDSVPVQKLSAENVSLFSSRECFMDSVNTLVEVQIPEIRQLLSAPDKSIIRRLYTAESAVVSLMNRFFEDISLTSEKNNSLFTGAKLACYGGKVVFTAEVSAEGIRFAADDAAAPSDFVRFMSSNIFRAAHRCDGTFTLSPVNDSEGRCAVYGSAKPRRFSPHRIKMLFNYIR